MHWTCITTYIISNSRALRLLVPIVFMKAARVFVLPWRRLIISCGVLVMKRILMSISPGPCIRFESAPHTLRPVSFSLTRPAHSGGLP
jgi:hypothetical protein